jgi:hypothetical protein
MSAQWFFRFLPEFDVIELRARVTGEGGLIGDMVDQLARGWRGRGTSFDELVAAAPGIILVKGDRFHIVRERKRRP